MRRRKWILTITTRLLLVGTGGAQALPQPIEDHQPSIHGLRVGMTVQQALDVLDPLPYSAKSATDGTVFCWNLPDASYLEFTAQSDRLAYIYLRYPKPRSVMDLWLENPDTAARRGTFTLSDSRLRRDYRFREPLDKTRIIWSRREKTAAGYETEIGFVSVARTTQPDSFGEFVEFKYLSVPQGQIERFQQSYRIAVSKEPAEAAKSKVANPPVNEEDHLPLIYGVRLGMTAQQVYNIFQRMPDTRQDLPDDMVVSWTLASGDVMELHFRGEHIWQVGLRYKEPRPTTDLWLLPLAQSASGGVLDRLPTRSAPVAATTGPPAAASPGAPLSPNPYGKLPPGLITGRDPRWRVDYHFGKALDKSRAVWTRHEKSEDGYRVEIRFMSVSRERMGDRYEEYVEFKYVGVAREDLEKFDRANRRP